MPKLTVYSWQDDRRQQRRVCAAASKAALLRITGYPSMRWLFNLGSPSAATEEHALALANPGRIYGRYIAARHDAPWERVN